MTEKRTVFFLYSSGREIQKSTFCRVSQEKDSEDEYAARKSLNELFNNDVTRTKLAKASRKEYKLLDGKGGKRKRCRSTIRRKRKGRSERDWDGDDKDDDRKYKGKKRAKRVGNSWKANEPEISPLGFINVPDPIWKMG
eukprot:4420853-Ditylum_brightwellii.AAC.1